MQSSQSENTSPNLDEQDGVASAGALVELGGGGGAVEAGGDEVPVKVGEGGQRRVGEAGDQNIPVLVLSDGQIMGAGRQEVQHLTEKQSEFQHCFSKKRGRYSGAMLELHNI